ncbi:hypothetical protein, partial [Streptococcus suis]|uniref:hypothetical protein n=1 Tax=Streptococcus suis TaxID=1307 RepID=UPI001E5E09C6
NSKYFSSNTLMDLTNGRKRVRLPTPAQLKRFSEPFELGNRANFVRNNRNGQIWSVKLELLRFASQILSPTFNSPLDC